MNKTDRQFVFSVEQMEYLAEGGMNIYDCASVSWLIFGTAGKKNYSRHLDFNSDPDMSLRDEADEVIPAFTLHDVIMKIPASILKTSGSTDPSESGTWHNFFFGKKNESGRTVFYAGYKNGSDMVLKQFFSDDPMDVMFDLLVWIDREFPDDIH